MSGCLRILIVEDDVQSQRMLDIVLKHLGHETIFAADGSGAVGIIKMRQFDLVFMDIQMPVMDGLEATRQIREWESGRTHLPIIGVTASIDERLKNYLQVGMDYVIFKPFDIDRLHEVIDACTNQKEIAMEERTESPTSPMLELPILDVRGAVRRFAGDRENYLVLLGEFVSSLPGRFQELTVDFVTGNWRDLSDHIHNLKGLSASFGAVKLSRNAMELEQQINAGWYGNAEEKINQIGDSIHILQSKMLELSKHPHTNEEDYLI